MSWLSSYVKRHARRWRQSAEHRFPAGECVRRLCEVQSRESIRTIFDVGCNQGQTIRLLRPLFPLAVIHAFEPGEEAHAAAAALCRDDSRLFVRRMALGEAPGRLELRRYAGSVTDSLLPEGKDYRSSAPPEYWAQLPPQLVEVDTLDAYCAREGVDRIDLLKIDTQGFDDRVLRGGLAMLRSGKVAAVKIELIFVEQYRGQARFGDMLNLLEDCGFRLLAVADQSPPPPHIPDWGDAIFVHRDAISRASIREQGAASTG
jgi:FkbM family methyltransferase